MGQSFHEALLQEISGDGGITETVSAEGVEGLAMVE